MQNNKKLQTVFLRNGENSFGRDETSNRFNLSYLCDEKISRRHFIIYLNEKGASLQDCSSYGTKLNLGYLVKGVKVLLKNGDKIDFLNYSYVYIFSGEFSALCDAQDVSKFFMNGFNFLSQLSKDVNVNDFIDIKSCQNLNFLASKSSFSQQSQDNEIKNVSNVVVDNALLSSRIKNDWASLLTQMVSLNGKDVDFLNLSKCAIGVEDISLLSSANLKDVNYKIKSVCVRDEGLGDDFFHALIRSFVKFGTVDFLFQNLVLTPISARFLSDFKMQSPINVFIDEKKCQTFISACRFINPVNVNIKNLDSFVMHNNFNRELSFSFNKNHINNLNILLKFEHGLKANAPNFEWSHKCHGEIRSALNSGRVGVDNFLYLLDIISVFPFAQIMDEFFVYMRQLFDLLSKTDKIFLLNKVNEFFNKNDQSYSSRVYFVLAFLDAIVCESEVVLDHFLSIQLNHSVKNMIIENCDFKFLKGNGYLGLNGLSLSKVRNVNVSRFLWGSRFYDFHDVVFEK